MWPSRCLSGSALLAILTVLATAPGVAAERRLEGPGLLLPIQDRVGDAEIVATVFETLWAELAARHDLLDRPQLRDSMRRLRLRDTRLASPRQLAALGEELGAAWFFSPTLHEAVGGTVPQITISARLQRVGGTELPWAGFEAASGLDERRWLGLGGTDSLEQLAREVAARLARAALDETAAPNVPLLGQGRSKKGFLSPDLTAGEPPLVAVLPFDSVSDLQPAVTAEIATEVATATLHGSGLRLLPPGRVDQLQRERGRLLRGESDAATRRALREEGGVGWLLTGTVETFRAERSLSPDPWVALSARLIDATSGRILWMSGLERTGADSESVFDMGRIYSAGALLDEMMQALTSEFLQ